MNARLSGFVATMLLAASTGSSGAWAADRPPKDLHWTGDHWTAWNPPPIPAPPSTEQIHIVVRGDTLWSLAAHSYGNPYLWPQLWEKNKYILDAHWIYPGDPLVLGPQVTPAEQLSGAGAAAGAAQETPAAETPGEPESAPSAPKAGVLSAGAAASAPIPLGAESDIYCSGYIGDPGEQFPFAIVGSEYDVMSPLLSGHAGADIQGTYGTVNTVKYGLYTGDIVYLDGGKARGLTAGSIFTAVAPRQEVYHPVDHHLIGKFYRYLGRVRVLSVQETTAIAEIVHACDPITVGTLLQPFQPEPVPLGRPTAMRPVNFPAAADKLSGGPAIVLAQDDIVSLGQDHVVYIDRGALADVTPGDVYTIYRLNKPGLPPLVLGELAVLSVHPKSSVARILRSRYTVYVGDRLDPK